MVLWTWITSSSYELLSDWPILKFLINKRDLNCPPSKINTGKDILILKVHLVLMLMAFPQKMRDPKKNEKVPDCCWKRTYIFVTIYLASLDIAGKLWFWFWLMLSPCVVIKVYSQISRYKDRYSSMASSICKNT